MTRWAIHDADKFESIVKRLRGFIDGLQDISKSLGVFSDQQARLKEEIESISDTENLQLICNAVGQEDLADVARQQLRLQAMSCGTREPGPLENNSNLAKDGSSISSIGTSDPQLALPLSASRSQVNQYLPATPAPRPEMHLSQPSARKTLTENDRRRMCQYHDKNPYIEYTEIGGSYLID